MQAKEILNMPAIINMEIVSAQIELEHYKRLASQMEKCFVEDEETKKQRENLNEIINNCKKTITEKFASRIEAERKICALLNKLHDERTKNALKFRYICGMSYEKIGEAMSYCSRQVRRICEKGIEELEQGEVNSEK